MQTRSPLNELFELLEEYAPVWYSEEHRRRALQALGQSADAGFLDTGSTIGGPAWSSLLLCGPDAQGAEPIRPRSGVRSCRLLRRKG